MTSLLNQLQVGARALSVHRVAQSTASNNIENVNTPGYARQRADLAAGSVGPAFEGRGVELLGVSRARDNFLDARAPVAIATASFSSGEAGVLTSVTSLDPEAPFGIPTSIGRFFSVMRELSRAPSDPNMRQAFVSSAQDVGRSFQRTLNNLEDAQVAADEAVRGQVAQVNRLADDVAALNAQIRQSEAVGQRPNELYDQRVRAAEELAGLTGARVVQQDGAFTVQFGTTALVVGDRSFDLSATPNPELGGRLSLVVEGTGGGTQAIASSSVGGSIGGILQARDGEGGLAGTIARVNAFAADFAASVNDAFRQGTGLDGSTGNDLFVDATGASAGRTIAVNAAIVADQNLVATSGTGAVGDNGNVLRMLALETTPLNASGQTPADTMATLVERFGSTASRALQAAAADGAVRDSVLSMRDSVMGVSIDEELIEMTRAQRAFEAATKVIQTADQMLDTLLKLR